MTTPAPDPSGSVPEHPVVEYPPPPISVRSFGLTDPGQLRKSNEDHFLIAELVRTLWVHLSSLSQPETRHGRNRGHIFLVADGMGGHKAGEVASALSVATIESFVLNLLHRFSNLAQADEAGVLKDLQLALRQADARIFEETAHHPEWAGMGTTLTMAFSSGWKLFVIHAGDSRCYLFRKGTLRQLTIDHTMTAEMIRHGLLKTGEAAPPIFRHVITSSLGGNKPGVEVNVQRVDLETGDRLLLCSDGLTDMLNNEQIAAILEAEREPQAACQRLIAQANEQGGRDNVTVIVANFEAV
jgi:PPM family protein phosphatase